MPPNAHVHSQQLWCLGLRSDLNSELGFYCKARTRYVLPSRVTRRVQARFESVISAYVLLPCFYRFFDASISKGLIAGSDGPEWAHEDRASLSGRSSVSSATAMLRPPTEPTLSAVSQLDSVREVRRSLLEGALPPWFLSSASLGAGSRRSPGAFSVWQPTRHLTASCFIGRMDDDLSLAPDNLDSFLREAEDFGDEEEEPPFDTVPSFAYASRSSSPPASSSAPSLLTFQHLSSSRTDALPAGPDFRQAVSSRKRRVGGRDTEKAAHGVSCQKDSTVEDFEVDEPSLLISSPDSTCHRPKRVRRNSTSSSHASLSPSSFPTPSLHRGTARCGDLDALRATCCGPLAFGFDDWGSSPSLTFTAPSSSRPSQSLPSGNSTVRARSARVFPSTSGAFFSSSHALRESVYRFAACAGNRARSPVELPADAVVPSCLLGPLGEHHDNRGVRSASSDGLDNGAGSVLLQRNKNEAALGSCLTRLGDLRRVRVFPVDVPGGGVPVFLPVTSSEGERRRQEEVRWSYAEEAETAAGEALACRKVKKTLRRPLKEILR